jgi:hypothetical protein
MPSRRISKAFNPLWRYARTATRMHCRGRIRHDKNLHEQQAWAQRCTTPYRSHAFNAARAPKAVAAKPNPAAIAPDCVMREQQVMIPHTERRCNRMPAKHSPMRKRSFAFTHTVQPQETHGASTHHLYETLSSQRFQLFLPPINVVVNGISLSLAAELLTLRSSQSSNGSTR